MIDLFPKLFTTTQAIPHFSGTLAGFKDSEDRFKFFDGDESPTAQTPFISAEIQPGDRDQRTKWQIQTVMFHCTGQDTDTALLWAMANAIVDYYEANAKFSDGTQYQLVGKPATSQGRNPVTEHRIVTVALDFGMGE